MSDEGGKLSADELKAMGLDRPSDDPGAADRLRDLEVPPSEAALIIAHGLNNANGKRVLYVAVDEEAMGVLANKEPVLSVGGMGVPGLEGWELIVIGPAGITPFLAQVVAASTLELPDNADPMAGHGQ